MGFPKVPDGLRGIAERLGLGGLHQYLSQDLLKWVNGIFNADNSIKLQSLADTAANNNSVYYSTTAGKVVWKDSVGVVHNLS